MKKFYLLLLFCIFSASLLAQQKVSDAGLIRLLKLQDSLRHRLPIEKLYLQTDKPFYAVGDTIWFKGYLFNADYLKYSGRSGLMYVELANDTNTVVFRRMVPVGYGISYGQIAIDGKDIPEGSYILRAYTNWQRNFGEDYIFTKNLYITGAGNQPWLVKVKSGSSVMDGKENVQAALQFADVNQHPLALHDMQLKVNDGNHNLLRGKAQTDAAGTMDVNFNLPPKANKNNLAMQAQDLQKGDENHKQNIPIVLNRPENTDLQFMPEGGNLVAGIPTKVGFKAIGEDGKGTSISGKIYNSKQEEVTTFTSLHKGMGSFNLTPKPNETYTAKVMLPNGQSKTYLLPQVKTSGTVLNIQDPTLTATATAAAQSAVKVPHVRDLEGAVTDSLLIHLTTTPDQQQNTYYLTAQSRGVICYAQIIHFGKSITQNLTIATNLFPTGIARFSLLNQQGQPLNERIVYIDHNDNLQISIKPNKQTYTARDSVALSIRVTDKHGKPIQGSFSIAVTDNEQVINDSTANNLTSNLLLTSDLKGTIEAPQYYLQNKNKLALDNLLLTQGWTGYDWPQVTAAEQSIKFEAEPEFQIKGRVINMLNKKVSEANILLAAKNYKWDELAKADKNGRFVFTHIPITDSADFFLKAANSKTHDMGIGISVDEMVPPQFNQSKVRYLPWYVSADTALWRSVSKGISSKLDEENLTGDHVLKQVNIKEKKVIPFSHNLNGPGDADQIIDEKEIEKAGVETLDELLELKAKRLRVHYPQGFMIDNLIVHFVIDGKDLDRLWDMVRPLTPLPVPTPWLRYNFMKGYLDSYLGKDILGVEIMTNMVYTDKYNLESDPWHPKLLPDLRNGGVPPFAYIEITTRNGYGPYIKTAAGTENLRPLPFIIAKQFYRPRYVDKTPGALKDLRSTIHWEPLVVTDKDGKATVSFYASDRPNNYTLVIEGSDMNGNIGSFTQKLTLNNTSP